MAAFLAFGWLTVRVARRLSHRSWVADYEAAEQRDLHNYLRTHDLTRAHAERDKVLRREP